jgi:hypothetical protein
MVRHAILLPLPRAGEGRGEGSSYSPAYLDGCEIAPALTLTLSRKRERELE